MIQTVNVDVANPVNFYDEYKLTDEDIDYLYDMAMSGQEQEAIDVLVEEHIVPAGTKYSDLARRYLELSTVGVIEESTRNKVIRILALLSIGLAGLWYYNYSRFVNKVYSPQVFAKAQLKESEVQRAILSVVLNDFKQSTEGAMAQTNNFVLGGIRAFQKEMVVENLFVKRSRLVGEELDAEITRFKKTLKIKYPEFYRGIEDGKILVSRKFSDGSEQVRHYKLDYYADMATRTTILNVDRSTNLIIAHANGDKVIEFVWLDHRTVKKDREICQEVLNHKVEGKSLLALDETTAEALGIMTVEEFLADPEKPCGVGCRHGFAALDRNALEGINKIIEQNS